MAKPSPENIVRDYLDALDGTNVDADKLQAQIDKTTDKLEELHLRAQLAQAHDASKAADAFIAVAAGYAAEHNIPASTFADMGVPADVLEKAGLTTAKPKTSTRRKTTSRKKTTAKTSTKKTSTKKTAAKADDKAAAEGTGLDALSVSDARKKRLQDEINAMGKASTPMTINDIAELTGMARSTILTDIKALMEVELVEEFGTLEDANPTGKPPKGYVLASK